VHLLAEHGVVRHTGATLLAIEPGLVRYADPDGAEHALAADAVVLSDALAPDDALATALSARGIEVHAIGDCRAPRTFEEAIYEATTTASAL